MRLTLIAAIVAASAASLSAQTARGTIHTGQPPAPRVVAPAPAYYREYDDDGYGRESRIIVPRLSMDSVARLVEKNYPGWFVRSKQLTRECQGPVYLFEVISAGVTGDHYLRLDADTGEALNPEVVGAKPETVLVPNCGYHREAFSPYTRQ